MSQKISCVPREASVHRQIAVTVSTSALIFETGSSSA
jgi:hypothetical protein